MKIASQWIGAVGIALLTTACGTFTPGGDMATQSTSANTTPNTVGTGTNTAQLPSDNVPVVGQMPYTAEDAFFDALPKGADARAVLCALPLGQDDVVAHLCVPNPPVLRGLKDLQNVLGFGFANPTATGSNGGADGNPVYAITGHSSSLVVSSVSTINPRTILCRDFGRIAVDPNGPKPANPNFFACMGFTRGENIVEVATTDAGNGILNFYIIRFETACSINHTCTPGDLFTPAVEQEWVAYNAYEDDPFLKNTILDCRQCHQNNGLEQPILRLQENTAPYTHFFSNATTGGKALLQDFWAAHGTNEDYGPVPAPLIAGSDGGKLADFLAKEGFGTQPNAYPSATIEQQVAAANPNQPMDNTVPGVSAAWNTVFNVFQQGQNIPPPFHDVKITDPAKLAAYTVAYQSVMNGDAAPSVLPDIRQIFSDDKTTLAQEGLAAMPGQTAAQLFTSMCQQCHNSGLDQNLTRAKFNVTTLLAGGMSTTEKLVAVSRLTKAGSDLQLMPPKRFRSLTSDEITLMVNYLEGK